MVLRKTYVGHGVKSILTRKVVDPVHGETGHDCVLRILLERQVLLVTDDAFNRDCRYFISLMI